MSDEMPHKIAVLPGDGIGPEITAEALKVLKATEVEITFEEALVGGAAYDDGGHPLPAATLDLCKNSDAVLLGAVGGDKWDCLPPELRPERGALLPLRKELGLYANLRPAKAYQALQDDLPLKNERGLIDLIVVRELTGGLYFGRPQARSADGNSAVDTLAYTRAEIERITLRAFELARLRKKEIISVDKANVLETSKLWREVVDAIAAKNPEIAVWHMYVDNCAMQLISNPGQFDVVLTENTFGDILSDEASVIAGSLGMLPSASLGESKDGRSFGLYEPSHGSAPKHAGLNKVNPIATIMSAAMMLRLSLGEVEAADRIEAAVEAALNAGKRTYDITRKRPEIACSTSEMGDAIVAAIRE